MLDVLHVIGTRLRPGHLKVCVGDSSRRCEENAKKSRIAPLNAIVIIIIIIIIIIIKLCGVVWYRALRVNQPAEFPSRI